MLETSYSVHNGDAASLAAPVRKTAPEPRRRWTAGEVVEVVSALAAGKTADIAKALGVHPKALRALLRRNGVSLRTIRENTAKQAYVRGGGLVIRRSVAGPNALYGAEALVELPDHACRWPIGDPANPDFEFCGAKSLSGSAYCVHHRAVAFERQEGRVKPRQLAQAAS